MAREEKKQARSVDRDAKVASERRERLARWLLVPLLLGVLLLLPFAPRLSCNGVDDFTTLEMIRGIAERGLPATVNVPGFHLPELNPRWMIDNDDLSWGKYPPIYPYLMAPLYLLGGVGAVIGSSVLLLAVCALGAFWLGRRLGADPMVGTLAAYVTLTSGLVWSRGFTISPFSMVLAALTWMLCAASRAQDEAAPPGSRDRAGAWAVLSGLLGGVAAGSHVLALPLVLAVVPALLPARSPVRPSLRALAAAARPAAWFMVGVCAPLALVAFVNHRRFGSWSPVTYGPCAWRVCQTDGLADETAGAALGFAAPALAWLGATAIGSWWAVRRRSRVLCAAVAAVAVLSLLPPTLLRERVVRMGLTLWYFVVHVPEGLDAWKSGTPLHSMLETTPVLALALGLRLSSVLAGPRRRTALLLILPSLAGLLTLALRANLPVFHMLGASRQVLRYAAPLVPPLAVLAAAALRELPWRRWHAWGGALLFAVLASCLLGPGDMASARRFLVLHGTLACAAVALGGLVLSRRLASSRWGRVAAPAAAAALIVGAAVGTLLDLRQILTRRLDDDRQVATLAALMPERFALVGVSPQELVVPLSLRATRDIEYADETEARGCDGLRRLLLRWADADRPIYYAGRHPGARDCLPRSARWQQVDAESRVARLISAP